MSEEFRLNDLIHFLFFYSKIVVSPFGTKASFREFFCRFSPKKSLMASSANF